MSPNSPNNPTPQPSTQITSISSPTSTTGSPLQELSAIRKIRFEQTSATRESVMEKERTERLAREKARLNTQTPTQTKYIAEQKKIREEMKAERARILQNVEGDKVERRIKEARRLDERALGGTY